MIEDFELLALEEDLDGYRSKLKGSDERKIAFVFGPHKWIVDLDKKMVRDGRMSPTEAKQRRSTTVINCLRRAERLRENNQRRDYELAKVRAEYRRARAQELQMSAQP
jgi:hypothetical protein